MSTRHEDNDGSDIFWPGYVDATTNLILNLLFLLTILMVAVFMFALELGRSTPLKPGQPEESIKQDVEVVSDAGAGLIQVSEIVQEIDPVQENVALRREIKRLKEMLAERVPKQVQAGGLVENVDATSSVPRPLSGLDKALASDFEVIVRFKDEAVAFTPEERDRVLDSLQSIDATGKVSIAVEVPTGFSEAKRMGFYRAMVVRNLLLEMKIPQEKIDVSVVEGRQNANASIVRVRSR